MHHLPFIWGTPPSYFCPYKCRCQSRPTKYMEQVIRAQAEDFVLVLDNWISDKLDTRHCTSSRVCGVELILRHIYKQKVKTLIRETFLLSLSLLRWELRTSYTVQSLSVDVLNYGRKLGGEGYMYHSLPQTPLPQTIYWIMSCNCEGDRHCNTHRCSCKKQGVKCICLWQV